MSLEAPTIDPVAREVHQRAVLADLHVDIILQQRLFGYDIRKHHEPWKRRQPFFRHADIPRMIEGGYDLAVLGVHYWPFERKGAWREVTRQLDYFDYVIETDERVVAATSAGDVRSAKGTGKLALMPGLEGGHLLGGDLSRIASAAERGAAYLTLAHFNKNSLATPSMGRGANQTDGLSSMGLEAVAELNRVGMIVDVAHVNEPGVLDACKASSAPVIASHTIAKGAHDHRRGVSDEGALAVAQTGGLVAVMFAPGFLAGKGDVSIEVVVDHMMHLVELIGAQHVGVGTDFDGWIPSIPNDIRDCRDMALMTEKMLGRGLSEEDVCAILGDNFLRVLEAVKGA